MGRKPNPIINEYFERGQKLEDASNRYQHTCRSCGEKFPKGRIDTLIGHLVKRCPCLSVQQRTEISHRAHELPRTVQTPTHSNDDLHATHEQQNGISNGQSMELGYAPAPAHEMSALETLAEVSRQQHLHLSGRPLAEQINGADERRISGKENGMQTGFVPEDFLVQEPSQQGPENEHGASRNGMAQRAMMALMYADVAAIQIASETQNSNGIQPPPMYDEPPQSTSPQPAVTSAPSGVAPTAQMTPSPLEIAASAAQELQEQMASNSTLTMEPEPTLQGVGAADNTMTEKPFSQRPSWASNIDPQLQQGDQNQNALAELLRNGVAAYPRPIAMNPHQQQLPYPEISMTHTRQKPKVRGRFSDHRRKEVQDVRKRGACIRCRMLKKPCSGDDPCSTCVNVESARLWKSPCIRTRIAEEFNLYSTNLHTVLAFHDVGRAKLLTHFQQSQGRIEATHFPELGLATTYHAVRSQKLAHSDIDPALIGGAHVPGDGSNLQMLDAEADDLVGKIELYSRDTASTFFQREPSAFMKPTVLLAQRLVQEQNDTLLQRALELWVSTQILTDNATSWNIFSNPLSTPQPGLVQLQFNLPEHTTEPSYSSTQPLQSDSPSYILIASQLAAATEKRCAALCKTVLNELEKRLLQRHYSSPFSTFLAAVIILACIERVAVLFRGWEDPNAPPMPEYVNSNGFDPNTAHDTPMQDGPLTNNLEHIPQSDREIAQQLLAASNPPPPSTPQPVQQSQPPVTPTNGISTGQHDTEMPNYTHETPATTSNPTSSSSPLRPQPASSSPTLLQDSTPHTPPSTNSPGAPSALPRYPLDRPPRYYIRQGERFADILYMLLRMRGLPPKLRPETSVSAAAPSSPATPQRRTKLVAVETPGTPNGIGEAEPRRGSAGGMAGSEGLVKEWLENLGEGLVGDGSAGPCGGGVSAEWLRSRAEAEWKEGDPRCWEGKWVARLLLGG